MKQPLVAPAALGGSVIAGVAAMLIGGYRIADCLEYRQGRGYCDEVVTNNAISLVAGVSAIIGSVAGLFTYNPSLERPDTPVRRRRRVTDLPATESPFGEVPVPPVRGPRLSGDEIEDIARDAFKRAIDEGVIPRVGKVAEVGEDLRKAHRKLVSEGKAEPLAGPAKEPPPPPPAAPLEEEPEEKIRRLAEEGWSQQSIADHMETTVYQVRKALGKT